MYNYKTSYASFMVATKQKSITNTQNTKRKETKYITTENYQIPKEDSKRIGQRL